MMEYTEHQKKVILRHLRLIYSTWHACALRAPLHEEDKARGLKVGQLCDDCEAYAAAHLADIVAESAQ